MPFLTPAEINTHLYGEVVTEISRADGTLLQSAIDAAIAEARGYFKQYDVDAIFNAAADARNPIVVLYTKDIAVWHYIQLANPAVDMALRKTRYDDAKKWMMEVQRGLTNPDLPVPADPVDNAGNVQSAENFMKWGGNKRRGNYQN